MSNMVFYSQSTSTAISGRRSEGWGGGGGREARGLCEDTVTR